MEQYFKTPRISFSSSYPDTILFINGKFLLSPFVIVDCFERVAKKRCRAEFLGSASFSERSCSGSEILETCKQRTTLNFKATSFSVSQSTPCTTMTRRGRSVCSILSRSADKSLSLQPLFTCASYIPYLPQSFAS